jgi:hypothetical protein
MKKLCREAEPFPLLKPDLSGTDLWYFDWEKDVKLESSRDRPLDRLQILWPQHWRGVTSILQNAVKPLKRNAGKHIGFCPYRLYRIEKWIFSRWDFMVVRFYFKRSDGTKWDYQT